MVVVSAAEKGGAEVTMLCKALPLSVPGQRWKTDCLMPKLGLSLVPLPADEKGACRGNSVKPGLSSDQPEKNVCGSLHPLLAPIPGEDSTWWSAFIKFLFSNYMLIVTNQTTRKWRKWAEKAFLSQPSPRPGPQLLTRG